MPVDGDAPLQEGRSLLELAQHDFAICNACRYCEGYCAVFPAMERRSLFMEGDLAYLANLCHDCRACTQACMYAEPHEFAINIPKVLTEARIGSWSGNLRPRWLSRAFERGPLTLLTVNLVVFLLVLAVVEAFQTLTPLFAASTGPGAFYAVVSHVGMVVPASLLTAYGAAVLRAGLVGFWRDAGGKSNELLVLRLWLTALREAMTLRWMRGGGAECYYPDAEQASKGRRLLHASTMYGFMLTFLATISAFVEENAFGIEPPYPLLSVPVLLGTLGGIGVIVGCIGLVRLKRKAASDQTVERAAAMDYAFLLSLLLVSVTGTLLLILRDTELMRLALIVHLSTVFAFYLSAPYGKFVHGFYRFAAVLRSVQERLESDMTPLADGPFVIVRSLGPEEASKSS
jgi:citrate/tricarballylate utilization protein